MHTAKRARRIAGALATTAALLALAACSVEDSEEYQALSDDLAAAQAEVDSLEADVEAAQAELVEVEGDLPAREEALAEAQRTLDKDQAALDKQLAAVEKREGEVAARERKVGIVERTIANNTVPGDGIYRVGIDIKPGTYRSANNNGCYWDINSGPNDAGFIDNGFVERGPAIVSLSTGQFFEPSGCDDWVLQQ